MRTHNLSQYAHLSQSERWAKASGDTEAYGVGFYAATLSLITILKAHGRNSVVIPSIDNHMMLAVLRDMGVIPDVASDVDVGDVDVTVDEPIDVTVDLDIFNVPDALADILRDIER